MSKHEQKKRRKGRKEERKGEERKEEERKEKKPSWNWTVCPSADIFFLSSFLSSLLEIKTKKEKQTKKRKQRPNKRNKSCGHTNFTDSFEM